MSIGLNDKDTKKQEISTPVAWDTIIETLQANNIDGATVYEARGIYKLESENTLRAEIIDFDGNAYKNTINAIDSIKTALNQECIALEIVDTNSILI